MNSESDQIPSEKQISPTMGLDLDEATAIRHFLGKNRDEAAQLFFEDPLYYEGLLKWMGERAFAYYFPALEEYLESPASSGDADIVLGLMTTLELRISQRAATIKLIREPALRMLQYCRDNFGKFEIDDEIYGNLLPRLQKLIESVGNLSPSGN